MKKISLTILILVALGCAQNEKINPANNSVPSIWQTSYYQDLVAKKKLVFQDINNPNKQITFEVVDEKIDEVAEPCNDIELTERGTCPNIASSVHLIRQASFINNVGTEVDTFEINIQLTETNMGEFKEASIISSDLSMVLVVDLNTLEAKNLNENNLYEFEVLTNENGSLETLITYRSKTFSEEGMPAYITYSTNRGILEMGIFQKFTSNNITNTEYSRYRRVFD